MAQIQPISQTTTNTQFATVNGITNNDINAKIIELNKLNSQNNNMPQYDMNFGEYLATIRNNIMLDKILDNQNKIMQKLGIGEKLDVQI